VAKDPIRAPGQPGERLGSKDLPVQARALYYLGGIFEPDDEYENLQGVRGRLNIASQSFDSEQFLVNTFSKHLDKVSAEGADPSSILRANAHKGRHQVAALSNLLSDFAATEIGNPPEDFAANEQVMEFSFQNRFPDESAYFGIDIYRLQNLLRLFSATIELGVIFQFFQFQAEDMNGPSERPMALNDGDEARLRSLWIPETYAWGPIQLKKWPDLYRRADRVVFKELWEAEIEPFYKSHGIRGLWKTAKLGRLRGHCEVLFYAGARLGQRFDLLVYRPEVDEQRQLNEENPAEGV
jgi:hypothetical protein